MSTTSFARFVRSVGLLRHSAWDGLFVGLAALHGAAIVLFPHPLVIAIGIWWNSNTISHGFIHNPFFRSRPLNQAFAAYLSLLLGFPHALWRSRHLAHHAGRAARLECTPELAIQTALIVMLWSALSATVPWLFVTAYLPGFAFGMALCALQGHYEHDGGTRSYYGRFYNLLFFNDGYHVEHHACPGRHWTRLTHSATRQTSVWPPVLRWLETFSLESLERLVLRSCLLKDFVLRRHERALAILLRDVADVEWVGIVGGGLFPRTAIILAKLMPGSRLAVIDLNEQNLETASDMLPAGVEIMQTAFDPSRHGDFDLLAFPLSLQGDRRALYERPPAPLVLVHDWIWRPRGDTQIVSWLLLKRVNLVRS